MESMLNEKHNMKLVGKMKTNSLQNPYRAGPTGHPTEPMDQEADNAK